MRTPAPASAMSHFASNLASLARSKLHSGLTSGSMVALSLHRWVLLKNSIIRADDSALLAPSVEPDSGTPSLVLDANDAEDEDEDELLSLDCDLFNFNFFFPDPGHGAEAPQDAAAIATEAQWFDSLLETLGDDEDEDNRHRHLLNQLPSVVKVVADGNVYHSNAHPPLHSEPASPASSYSDEFNLASPPSPSSPIAVPYPVPYPPLVKPYGAAAAHDDADDEPCYYAPRVRPAATATATVAPYFLPYDDLEDSYLSMPDAMEDSASDDDTEPLPATPFSRSRSSFSLSNSDDVDPASVPLPREQRARGERPSMRIEPRIYASADDVFPFDPNPDMHSDTTPVYTPFFYQNC